MYLVIGFLGVLFSSSLSVYCKKKAFSIKKTILSGFLYSLLFVIILNAIFLINAHIKNIDLDVGVVEKNFLFSLIYCLLCVLQCFYEVSKK